TLQRIIPNGCEWLELGCGHQMFASWMNEEQACLSTRSCRLIGIDRDFPALRSNPVIHHAVYGDIQSLPFAACSFDIVTANMVIEHLKEPTAVLEEVHRVLRRGGLFIFHTPNRTSAMVTLLRIVPQFVKNIMAHL